MLGYDLIPNSPESATLYDENSLISTRPDSLENILFDSNKKMDDGIMDDTYNVMNELDCFGNEENHNLQMGIDDQYIVFQHYFNDTKLSEPKYENLNEILCADANLNSASRSYLKSNTSLNMTADPNYFNNCNSSTNSNSSLANGMSNQSINGCGASLSLSNKIMTSTNKPFNVIDPNQFFAKSALPSPANDATGLNAVVSCSNGVGGSGNSNGNNGNGSVNGSRRGSTMTTPINYDQLWPNELNMGFDLNSYDMDEAASSSSGSHLAFSCTDPNILSDIPSRYLNTFNNIQNESM